MSHTFIPVYFFLSFAERLNLKDTYIMQTLSEKLQLYTDMADIYGFDDSSQGSKMRLFIGSDSADSLQGESALLAAIAEGIVNKCTKKETFYSVNLFSDGFNVRNMTTIKV